MNETTVLGAAEQAQDVRAYVAAVRAWLADLPADEVEDLTAGMEADLAERAAESGGTLGALLGQPEAYAAELRSAAGLPPRAATVVADAGPPREAWTDRMAREAQELVEQFPWLRELRPTWWLVRGAVAGWAVASVLGNGRFVLLPVVMAALSLALGLALRRREPLGTGPRLALGAGNTLAVVLLLPMLSFYGSGSSGSFPEDAGAPAATTGLSANGSPVTNVYAYDAAGQRVADVRLYDQYGQPITVAPDAVPVPVGPNGEELVAWPPDPRALSVFPLRLVATADPWVTTDGSWVPPMVVAPLAGSAVSSGAPSPSPSVTPSPAPSPSGTP